MDNILLELDAIKVSIEQAAADKNRAEGAKGNIILNIKKNYAVETEEGIKTILNKIDRELETIFTLIETKFKDLQENYSWEE